VATISVNPWTYSKGEGFPINIPAGLEVQGVAGDDGGLPIIDGAGPDNTKELVSIELRGTLSGFRVTDTTPVPDGGSAQVLVGMHLGAPSLTGCQLYLPPDAGNNLACVNISPATSPLIVEIDGDDIATCGQGIRLTTDGGAAQLTIVNSNIHDNAGNGVTIASDTVDPTTVNLYQTSVFANAGDGISVASQAGTTDPIVTLGCTSASSGAGNNGIPACTNPSAMPTDGSGSVALTFVYCNQGIGADNLTTSVIATAGVGWDHAPPHDESSPQPWDLNDSKLFTTADNAVAPGAAACLNQATGSTTATTINVNASIVVGSTGGGHRRATGATGSLRQLAARWGESTTTGGSSPLAGSSRN
jgi:hypothetical protein